MEIEWRPIPEEPGYSASNTGLIRSDHRVIIMKNGIRKTIRERILKQSTSPAGYQTVRLRQKDHRYVHVLVAQAFVGPRKGGYEVNHKDESKKNNAPDNLEYVTHRQNVSYGARNAKCRAVAMRSAKPVVGIAQDGTEIRFESLRAARRAGYTRDRIKDCLSGKRESYRGIAWKLQRADVWESLLT